MGDEDLDDTSVSVKFDLELKGKSFGPGMTGHVRVWCDAECEKLVKGERVRLELM